jgi:hypothetical protein
VDPDQSNGWELSLWSRSIRFGLGLSLVLDLVAFSVFLLFTLWILLFTPSACQNFAQKFQINFCEFLIIFLVFVWYFCMIKFDKKNMCIDSCYLFTFLFLFFWEILLCLWPWYLNAWYWYLICDFEMCLSLFFVFTPLFWNWLDSFLFYKSCELFLLCENKM